MQSPQASNAARPEHGYINEIHHDHHAIEDDHVQPPRKAKRNPT